MAVDLVGLRHRLRADWQALRAQLREVAMRHHDGELVTAQASEKILVPQRLFNRARDSPAAAVADAVTRACR